MSRSFDAILCSCVCALACALASAGCGSSQLGASERAATEKVAAVPPCPDSEESGCENGPPLCMLDESDACRLCHCTEYVPMASNASGDPRAETVFGPSPYNGGAPR